MKTERLEEVEIPRESILRFELGLPGFENLRSFALIQMAEDSDIRTLQSLEESHISFLVSSPFIFHPQYEFDLPEPVQEELELNGEEDLEILAILNVPGDISKATINLLAPLIVNKNNGKAKQYILRSNEYSPRHPIMKPDQIATNIGGGE
ncbi:flagellar assembly protein FliW [Paenibacillus sp. GCM10012307]|uniref:Flagellar assembly factor FliW n=1 Tax=Paenibacillus roseus TaxID=2798579 RepID=A0A934ML92_9BACL|nr:flagellar assembly protein FliW [Paenibacillus roseus]MBJ6361930.1 flagellar assembly protein FliW [Paenibacillus roseus]